MSTHTNHTELNEAYFCTVTCYQWISLFEITNLYNYIYSWFDRIVSEGCLILAFVIMPNHLHVILYPTNKNLNTIIGEGKRFMAYEIVRSLRNHEYKKILQKLSEGVSLNERKKGKIHQVFRTSFDGRLCYSLEMLEQKIDYIHHNPVSGKWNLVDDFVDYEHSSAAFYELGRPCRIKIKHYKDLF